MKHFTCKMKKVAFMILLVVMAVLLSGTALAADVTVIASGICGGENLDWNTIEGDNLTWNLTSDGVLTISGEGVMSNYDSLMAPWYRYGYRSDIKAVVIDDGVTSIGDCAFFQCGVLASVTIPDTVTSIGRSAFGNCPSLSSITIPESVTEIGQYAFNWCSAMTEVTIPESVTSIGGGAFAACFKLSSLSYKGTKEQWLSIGYVYMAECSDGTIVGSGMCGDNLFWEVDETGVLSITGTGEMDRCPWSDYNPHIAAVSMSNGLTSIWHGAFFWCDDLNEITIPNSVTSIGVEAFSGCYGLTSVSLPDGVTSISDGMFAGCSGLTTFPDSSNITSIGHAAFDGCSGLTAVVLPDGLLSMGTGVFAGCSNLASVTIPGSVTNIGQSPFYTCSSLTSIIFKGNAPALAQIGFETLISTIYYPANDETWTEVVGQNYGGQITWVAYSETEEPTIIPGDLDGDGEINFIDVNRVIRYYRGLITLDEAQLAAADINGDGEINFIDVNRIIRYYRGLINSLS